MIVEPRARDAGNDREHLRKARSRSASRPAHRREQVDRSRRDSSTSQSTTPMTISATAIEPRIAKRALGVFLERESGDRTRNRRDDEKDDAPLVVRLDATLDDDVLRRTTSAIHCVAEVPEHGDERAEVECDVEARGRDRASADIHGASVEMRRAADREELGESLDDAEDRAPGRRLTRASRDRGSSATRRSASTARERVLVERLVLRRRSSSSEKRSRASARGERCSSRASGRGRAESRARRAAMPSTSPTAQSDARLAIAHDLGKSAGVGADDRHAGRQRLERAQAERLALRWAGGRDRRWRAAAPPSRSCRGRTRRPATPSSRASASASTRSGPSPTMTSTRGISRATRAKIAHDVAHALHRPEVRDVHQHARPPRRPARRAAACSASDRRRRDR